MRICALFFSFSILTCCSQAKVLTQCEAASELRVGKVTGTFISNYVCLMKSESGFDTRKVSGPGAQSSYAYGVFQIRSGKWCTRGRQGGLCNKKCEDFANDDIQDDIACAKKIQEKDGFKYWNGWMKKCKSKPLPDISGCKRRRRREQGNSLQENVDEVVHTLEIEENDK